MSLINKFDIQLVRISQILLKTRNNRRVAVGSERSENMSCRAPILNLLHFFKLSIYKTQKGLLKISKC